MEPNAPINNNQPSVPTQPVASAPMPPVTTLMSPSPAPTQKGDNKALLWAAIVGGILATLLVLGGAYFAITKSKKNTATESGSPRTTQTASTPSIANKYANCLSKADLTAIQGDTYTLKDIDGVYHVYGSSIFFKPDSTNYEYADQVADEFVNYKKAFASLTSKDWNIELKGQIKDINATGNSADNKKLANERAAKVRDEFVRAGVPTSRIKILEPEIYDVKEIKPGDSDRNVSIDIQSRCSDKQIEAGN